VRTTVNRRIAELDGLRGLAALAVVFAHYFGEVTHGFRAFTVGWIGVDVFFVLSGFLIGSIILEQHARLGFFKTFYLKRAARIVPVYAAVCVLTLSAVVLTAGHTWSDQPFSPGVYAIFGTNFAMSLANTQGDLWLRPTWTLAVEEQFYLLLPALICLTPRRLLMPLLIGLWASASMFRLALQPTHLMAALTLLPCRMDFLLSGVVLALLCRSFDLTPHLQFLRITALISLAALLLLRYFGGANLFAVWEGAIASIGIACFIASILHGAPEAARYRSRALQYFGQISYCLYLVHQPVAGLLHGLLLNSVPDIGGMRGVAVTVLSLLVSIGIAALSWKWFEAPILARARHIQFVSSAPVAVKTAVL
jgi:peptidoglycan/LPS O-acetylase OafA/YrhL